MKINKELKRIDNLALSWGNILASALVDGCTGLIEFRQLSENAWKQVRELMEDNSNEN